MFNWSEPVLCSKHSAQADHHYCHFRLYHFVGCSSCKSIVKCCPHQKPSVMVIDKAVETRARQSLPDLLMFKPSSVIPGETGMVLLGFLTLWF